MKSLTFAEITTKIFRVFPHHTKIPNWGKMSSGEHSYERFYVLEKKNVFNLLVKG